MEKKQEIILKPAGDKQNKTFVHSDIVKYLKNHQIDGIKFLFENCYEQNSGCILAHFMGLGKTFQVISLLHAVINAKQHSTDKVLVLCTVSTIINWKEEIVRWLGPIDGHRQLQIFEMDPKDDINRKISFLQKWSQIDSNSPAACLIMGYDAFRILVNFHAAKANERKFNRTALTHIREMVKNHLLKPADIVVCDEGHIIKNPTAAITMAVNQIRTKRRIILTGTPVQNHLMEYYSMVDFVKPNFLGTKQHFNEYFAEPIKAGQHADSCEADIKYMKERSFALNKKLSKIVQRREISLLKDFLPEKFEFVLFVPLTDIQYKVYRYFLDNRGGTIEAKRLFGDYTCLRKIWTHPKVLDNAHRKSATTKKRQSKKPNDDVEDDNDGGDDENIEYDHASSGELQMIDNDWWRRIIDKTHLETALSSNKMILLFEILKECHRVGDKCVIFSGFVEVLNVVEYFMQQIDQKNGTGTSSGLANFCGPWKKNEDYYRLDGSTQRERRQSMITKFNDVNNKRTKAFLISSHAGGQGINLFGANRLILLDTSWNPSTDQQSIFRIYRMGQVKRCYIYRLLSMGTMEEKIYSRSVTKQAMSCRVVDKQQIDRHYKMNELYELYSLTKPNMAIRSAPMLPKDNLLAHLLEKYPNMIYKYIEHDTLLANKEEEELNEVEKKEAWQRCQQQNLQMYAPSNLIVEQHSVTSASFLSQGAPNRVQVKPNYQKAMTSVEFKKHFTVAPMAEKTADSVGYMVANSSSSITSQSVMIPEPNEPESQMEMSAMESTEALGNTDDSVHNLEESLIVSNDLGTDSTILDRTVDETDDSLDNVDDSLVDSNEMVNNFSAPIVQPQSVMMYEPIETESQMEMSAMESTEALGNTDDSVHNLEESLIVSNDLGTDSTILDRTVDETDDSLDNVDDSLVNSNEMVNNFSAPIVQPQSVMMYEPIETESQMEMSAMESTEALGNTDDSVHNLEESLIVSNDLGTDSTILDRTVDETDDSLDNVDDSLVDSNEMVNNFSAPIVQPQSVMMYEPIETESQMEMSAMESTEALGNTDDSVHNLEESLIVSNDLGTDSTILDRTVDETDDSLDNVDDSLVNSNEMVNNFSAPIVQPQSVMMYEPIETESQMEMSAMESTEALGNTDDSVHNLEESLIVSNDLGTDSTILDRTVDETDDSLDNVDDSLVDSNEMVNNFSAPIVQPQSVMMYEPIETESQMEMSAMESTEALGNTDDSVHNLEESLIVSNDLGTDSTILDRTVDETDDSLDNVDDSLVDSNEMVNNFSAPIVQPQSVMMYEPIETESQMEMSAMESTEALGNTDDSVHNLEESLIVSNDLGTDSTILDRTVDETDDSLDNVDDSLVNSNEMVNNFSAPIVQPQSVMMYEPIETESQMEMSAMESTEALGNTDDSVHNLEESLIVSNDLGTDSTILDRTVDETDDSLDNVDDSLVDSNETVNNFSAPIVQPQSVMMYEPIETESQMEMSAMESTEALGNSDDSVHSLEESLIVSNDLGTDSTIRDRSVDETDDSLVDSNEMVNNFSAPIVPPQSVMMYEPIETESQMEMSAMESTEALGNSDDSVHSLEESLIVSNDLGTDSTIRDRSVDETDDSLDNVDDSLVDSNEMVNNFSAPIVQPQSVMMYEPIETESQMEMSAMESTEALGNSDDSVHNLEESLIVSNDLGTDSTILDRTVDETDDSLDNVDDSLVDSNEMVNNFSAPIVQPQSVMMYEPIETESQMEMSAMESTEALGNTDDSVHNLEESLIVSNDLGTDSTILDRTVDETDDSLDNVDDSLVNSNEMVNNFSAPIVQPQSVMMYEPIETESQMEMSAMESTEALRNSDDSVHSLEESLIVSNDLGTDSTIRDRSVDETDDSLDNVDDSLVDSNEMVNNFSAPIVQPQSVMMYEPIETESQMEMSAMESTEALRNSDDSVHNLEESLIVPNDLGTDSTIRDRSVDETDDSLDNVDDSLVNSNEMVNNFSAPIVQPQSVMMYEPIETESQMEMSAMESTEALGNTDDAVHNLEESLIVSNDLGTDSTSRDRSVDETDDSLDNVDDSLVDSNETVNNFSAPIVQPQSVMMYESIETESQMEMSAMESTEALGNTDDSVHNLEESLIVSNDLGTDSTIRDRSVDETDDSLDNVDGSLVDSNETVNNFSAPIVQPQSVMMYESIETESQMEMSAMESTEALGNTDDSVHNLEESLIVSNDLGTDSTIRDRSVDETDDSLDNVDGSLVDSNEMVNIFSAPIVPPQSVMIHEPTRADKTSVSVSNRMPALSCRQCQCFEESSRASTECSNDDGSLLSLVDASTDMDNIEKGAAKSLSAFAKGLLESLNANYTVRQHRNVPNTIDDYLSEEHIIASNQFNSLEYRVAFKRRANSNLNRPIKKLKLSLEIDPTASFSIGDTLSILPLMINDTAVRHDFVSTEHMHSAHSTNNNNLRSEDIRYASNVTNLSGAGVSSGNKIDPNEVIESIPTVNNNDNIQLSDTTTTSSLVFKNENLIKRRSVEGEICPESIEQSQVLVMNDIPHCDQQESTSIQGKASTPDISAEGKDVSSKHSHHLEESDNESMADRSTDDDEEITTIADRGMRDVHTYSNRRVYRMYWESEQFDNKESESSAEGETDVDDVDVDRQHHADFVDECDVLMEEYAPANEQPSTLSKIKDACILM